MRHNLLQKTRDALCDLQQDSGIELAGMIEEGKPNWEILFFSSESDSDLIVMGARGCTGIKGMLTGSVPDAVLRSTLCPVLVAH